MEENKKEEIQEELIAPKKFRDFNLFKKSLIEIGTISKAYGKMDTGYWQVNRTTKYTQDSIKKILSDSKEDSLRNLSREYFDRSGIYKRMLMYLANLLTFDYVVTPKKIGTKKFASEMLEKLYESCYFLDGLNVAGEFGRILLRMLVDGVYYGIFKELGQGKFVIQDLPAEYCRSRYKSANNNMLLELSVRYFDSFIPKASLSDKKYFPEILKTFPASIQKQYKAHRTGSENSNLIDGQYMLIEEDYGIAFYFYDCKPLFASAILAIEQLNEYKALEQSLDKQELKKILYQKIPMNDAGDLLISPEEATEIHRAGVSMLEKNSDVDVFTGFCEVDMLEVSSNGQKNRDNLEKMERSVFNEAGITKSLFASDSNLSLEHSINNDSELMMAIVLQTVVPFLNYHVNRKFSTPKKYFFEVSMLPITHYNREKMSQLYINGAQYGYSKIMAGVAFGLKQSNIMNQIELENDILGLVEKMIPLQSSYTSSSTDGQAKGGAPTKPTTEKTDKTIRNIDGQ